MPSATGSAHDACGLGIFATSTRHMRQLPAMFSLGWKQNTGTSRPAASHACSTVEPGGTSTSCPSIVSFGMRRSLARSADGITPRAASLACSS